MMRRQRRSVRIRQPEARWTTQRFNPSADERESPQIRFDAKDLIS
jgi:hypothetical protein